MNATVFRSRIDPLLAGVVILPIVAICGMLLQRAFVRGQLGAIALGIALLSLGLVCWIFASTSYRFSDGLLVVRSGPMRVNVPIKAIRRVTRTRTLASAPALSLQRLEIAYDKGGVVIISPKDEAGFLSMLKTRAPRAELPST